MSFQCESLEPRRLLAATTIRIDVGNTSTFTESSGKTWQADHGFTGGMTRTDGGDVIGTDSDKLFNTRRFGNFSYSLPIKNGDYKVRLLMMDTIFDSAGHRVFDVFSQKKLVLDNFDIAAVAGAGTAVTKTFVTTVNDGRLNLWWTSVIENAIVSAI